MYVQALNANPEFAVFLEEKARMPHTDGETIHSLQA